MLKLKKVAITGGVSCGKSQVGKVMQDLGAYVVNADQIVHHILTPETELGQKAIELLGSEVLVEGKIDRARTANKVFLNPRLLSSLENLLHPAVYAEIKKQFQEQSEKSNPPRLFVAEVPLLFETGGERFFENTITVIADKEKCWERYRNATGQEREDFNRRMARQMAPEEKAKRADYIIENNGTLEELKQQTTNLFYKLNEENSD